MEAIPFKSMRPIIKREIADNAEKISDDCFIETMKKSL